MVTDAKLISEKKIVRWGQGYGVFLSKEIRKLSWDDKTKVKITVLRDSILIEKI